MPYEDDGPNWLKNEEHDPGGCWKAILWVIVVYAVMGWLAWRLGLFG